MATENPQPAPRPEARIDDLLGLLAADWKKSGTDQRFFQYVENLRHRLGLAADPYHVEDTELIARLQADSGPASS